MILDQFNLAGKVAIVTGSATGIGKGIALAFAQEGCSVVIEAAWGWYWIADLLGDAGFEVHLAHPLGVAGYRNRRVKNDERDAVLLADLLRMGSLILVTEDDRESSTRLRVLDAGDGSDASEAPPRASRWARCWSRISESRA